MNTEDWTAHDYLKHWNFKDLCLFPIKKLWSEVLLENGFKPKFDISYGGRRSGDTIHYNPKDNWHGVARYSPDQILYKGDYSVIISLQGLLTGYQKTEEEKNIIQNIGAKYIAVYNGKELLFETFFGYSIPEDIMKLLCE